MRLLHSKYSGNCDKCKREYRVLDLIAYEKMTGVFCPDCFPKDPEEIREFRQMKADRKADRYEGWAQKREERAETALNSYPEVRHDWAFITQPGRIPFRERMNRADARAIESLEKAKEMRQKAQSLRNVRVAGDAERQREAQREKARSWAKVGMKVFCEFGNGTIKKINKKTVTLTFPGEFEETATIDLRYIAPTREAKNENM